MPHPWHGLKLARIRTGQFSLHRSVALAERFSTGTNLRLAKPGSDRLSPKPLETEAQRTATLPTGEAKGWP
jgi:hypothetical protein